jgi:hypothetical protein
MAYYGRDYTSGRFTRNNMGDSGGYDSDFGGNNWYGGGWSGSRGRSWNEFNQNQGQGEGWGNRPRSNLDNNNWGNTGRSNFDNHWGNTGYGRGRTNFGSDEWTGNNRWQNGGYGGGMERGRMGNYGGSFDRNFYDRDMHGHGGSMGHDYDEDLGDRLRRGWSRVRDGARGWMGGRGYGGGW